METQVVKTLDFPNYRELGGEGTFIVSSAKPGNGVEQLRDDNLETYWQSDGSFPHTIGIQFQRRVTVSKVCLYLDYGADESYTPRKIGVSMGTCLHDLHDVAVIEINEPFGWIVIPLVDLNVMDGSEAANTSEGVRTHMIQVKILAMHQNGRDTHVRQVKILGPREAPKVMGNLSYESFHTIEMQQFALLR